MGLKLYAQIRKVDEEQRMVWGYASTEAIDSDGEVVSKTAIADAWDDYMKFANVREMHQPLAAGVVKEYAFDDKGVEIGVKVVDDAAWTKVKEQVYKGFSIGGRKKPGGYDNSTKTITGLELYEISLVDRPANPEALISLWKADGVDPAAGPTEPVAEDPAQGMTAEQFATFMKSAGFVDTLKRVIEANPELFAKAAQTEPATEPTAEPAPTEPAAREPSELRKAVRLLKADAKGVQKGLYTVGSLADTLQSLAWLQASAAYESEYEGDNSTVPAQLAEGLKIIGAALVAMAQEEVAELLASIPELAAADAEPIAMMCKAMEAGACADIFGKVSAVSFAKAGARNSSADQERIQKMHDLANELGAACVEDSADKNAVAKAHSHEHDEAAVAKVGKLEGDVTKVAGAVEQLSSTVTKQAKRLDEVSKQLAEAITLIKNIPAQPKGVLRVVSKGSELGDGGETEPEVTPVLKRDGSVDVVATQIKAIQKSGGMLIGAPGLR